MTELCNYDTVPGISSSTFRINSRKFSVAQESEVTATANENNPRLRYVVSEMRPPSPSPFRFFDRPTDPTVNGAIYLLNFRCLSVRLLCLSFSFQHQLKLLLLLLLALIIIHFVPICPFSLEIRHATPRGTECRVEVNKQRIQEGMH